MRNIMFVLLCAVLNAVVLGTGYAGVLSIGTGARVDYALGDNLTRTDAGDLNLTAGAAYAFSHFLVDFEQGGDVNNPSMLGLSYIIKGSVNDPDFYAGLSTTTRWLADETRIGFGPQLGVIVGGKAKLGLRVTYYPATHLNCDEWRVAYENALVLIPSW